MGRRGCGSRITRLCLSILSWLSPAQPGSIDFVWGLERPTASDYLGEWAVLCKQTLWLGLFQSQHGWLAPDKRHASMWESTHTSVHHGPPGVSSWVWVAVLFTFCSYQLWWSEILKLKLTSGKARTAAAYVRILRSYFDYERMYCFYSTKCNMLKDGKPEWSYCNEKLWASCTLLVSQEESNRSKLGVKGVKQLSGKKRVLYYQQHNEPSRWDTVQKSNLWEKKKEIFTTTNPLWDSCFIFYHNLLLCKTQR